MKGLEKGWLLIAFEIKILTSFLKADPYFCDIQCGIFSSTLCVFGGGQRGRVFRNIYIGHMDKTKGG